jgi:hypothetical protein
MILGLLSFEFAITPVEQGLAIVFVTFMVAQFGDNGLCPPRRQAVLCAAG